jgi:hypothetical protein
MRDRISSNILKAVPLMFIGMTTGGTMMFFSCVTIMGLVWVWFFLPETTGKSLESMDEMFNLPWYLIGRKGAQLTKGTGGMSEVLDTEGEKAVEAQMEHTGGLEKHIHSVEQKV